MTATNGDMAPRAAKVRELCSEIGSTDPGDTSVLAELLQTKSMDYYDDVRSQAKQSFLCALGAAVLGSAFFGIAVWPMMNGRGSVAGASLVAGAIVSVISGVNFWLYGKAADQFSTFHVCLERANRFMLANTLVDKLGPDTKDKLRAELIRTVATAPMLTLDSSAPSS